MNKFVAFWEELKAEYIYDILDFKNQYEQFSLSMNSVVEKIIFWHKESFDIIFTTGERIWIILDEGCWDKAMNSFLLNDIEIENKY